MPNHTRVDLVISGNEERIGELLKTVKGPNGRTIDLNKVIPMPLGYADNPAYTHYGYHWCVDNWGTKWNTYDCTEIDRSCKGLAVLGFRTAWTPPTPVIRHLSRIYPDLRFWMYAEDEGMAYAVEVQIQNGVYKEHDITSKVASRYQNDEYDIEDLFTLNEPLKPKATPPEETEISKLMAKASHRFEE